MGLILFSLAFTLVVLICYFFSRFGVSIEQLIGWLLTSVVCYLLTFPIAFVVLGIGAFIIAPIFGDFIMLVFMFITACIIYYVVAYMVFACIMVTTLNWECEVDESTGKPELRPRSAPPNIEGS